MKILTDGEAQLLANILVVCSEKFSNHGCNDIPDYWHKHFDPEESKELAQKIFTLNTGDKPEQYGIKSVGQLQDTMVMDYFANTLTE